MRKIGKITAWDTEKGFGFISPQAGGKSIFFHITAIENPKWHPKVDQQISFTKSTDRFGRPCAVRIRLNGHRRAAFNLHQFDSLLVPVAALFLIIVIAGVLFSKLSAFILVAYLLLSLVTYIIYAVDKSAAEKGTWRTRESSLHLLSLLGGWPGAIFAQSNLRHKTKKKSFRIVFFITMALNCTALLWLLT